MKKQVSRRSFLAVSGLGLTISLGGFQGVAMGQTGGRLFAYVGRATPGFAGALEGGGIDTFQVNMEDGSLELVSSTGPEVQDLNSDGMCVSADGSFLYCVNRTTALDGIPGTGGGVVAFSINRTDGSLRHLNTLPSMGAMPVGVQIDSTNSRVIVGNHGAVSRTVLVRERDGVPVIERPTDDATVALFTVEPDGSLSSVLDVHVFDELPVAGSEGLRPEAIGATSFVQNGPACHQVALDRMERWIIATDNGHDHIYVYPFNPNMRILEGRAFPAPPGAAPRHIAIHQTIPYFFVTNEREPSVSSYHLDSDSGEVQLVQTIRTLVDGDASPANIRLHPNGRFLYSSNRAETDTISVFAVDEGSGRLELLNVAETGGRGQREFNIEPSGRFLFACNPQSGDVITFALNPDTGEMTRTARTILERPMVIDFAML